MRIRDAAPEAHVFRRVFFLKRLLFHLVGRFCETPFECFVIQRRLAQTPYNFTQATRDTGATLAPRRVIADE